MASTHADIKIRALVERATTLRDRTLALADGASAGLADPALAVATGKTLGIATVVLRLAELLNSGAIPVSLLGLVEREADALLIANMVKE